MTAGISPSLTSVNAKIGVLGRHHDVADGNEAGAAAQRRAVDAADHRNRQPIHRLEHPRHLGGVVHVLIVAECSHPAHPLEIGAGAKGRSRAFEHDKPHAAVA